MTELEELIKQKKEIEEKIKKKRMETFVSDQARFSQFCNLRDGKIWYRLAIKYNGSQRYDKWQGVARAESFEELMKTTREIITSLEELLDKAHEY